MCTLGGQPTSARAVELGLGVADRIPADQGLHGRDRRLGDHDDDAAVGRERTWADADSQRRRVSSAARRSCRPSSAQLSSSRAAP